ncbi:hypothetical protein ACFPYJ_06340 [Paenibacillus solisilvae]|uniref:Cyclic lactone autoinducer peptide n=1 Tax=Paenibacillus solisilvae TaxID=2486751 RepID=A0ABW0VXE2_9BACL
MRNKWMIALALIMLISGVSGIGGRAVSAQESKLSQKTFGTPEELLPAELHCIGF